MRDLLSKFRATLDEKIGKRRAELQRLERAASQSLRVVDAKDGAA